MQQVDNLISMREAAEYLAEKAKFKDFDQWRRWLRHMRAAANLQRESSYKIASVSKGWFVFFRKSELDRVIKIETQRHGDSLNCRAQ